MKAPRSFFYKVLEENLEEDQEEDQHGKRRAGGLSSSDPYNRKVGLLKRDLVQIKTRDMPNTGSGHKHEEKVWEAKENIRKKIRKKSNADHLLGSKHKSGLRRGSAAGGNFAEFGLEFLTDEFFKV